MKRNYFIYLLILCLFLPFGSFSQGSSPRFEKIYIPNHGHDHPEPHGINDFFNDRSEFVKTRMADRNSNNCSDIIITYIGFGSSPQAQAAFQFAVEIWESLLVSDVTIRGEVTFAPQALGVLGSSSPDFFLLADSIDLNKLFPAALGEKILGQDSDGPNGTSNDFTITMNSNRGDWYFGTDGNTPINSVDFVSVALHELAHGLGFLGFGRETSSNEGAIRFDDDYSVWDTFVNGDDIFLNKVPILNESNYPDPSQQMLIELTGGALTSSSPLAIQENGGNEPLYFSPSPFQPGSSYSHWDENTFNNTPHALMTPVGASGEANHDPGTITLGFMEDMGWTLCQGSLSTPEFTADDIIVTHNPFNDEIIIDVPSQLRNQSFNITIIDTNGRMVIDQKVNIEGNEILISNLNHLEPSLYFMTLSSQNSDLSITKKLIKN